ncbi:MAG TPA: hypothetical protein PK256_12825, partial [Verrucomicrobiota bacterium]|nr:hypothetical protein [Verrucomicrobiota bacterium]
MKTKIILAISLCLNLVLALGYFLTDRKRESQAAAPAVPAATSAVSVMVRTNSVGGESSAVRLIDWRMVESEDYRKYISNLKAIGCPEETIRDIIIADVNKLFESRRIERGKTAKRFEYWRTGQQILAGLIDEEKIKEQQDLVKEKRALLKELLGVEPDLKADLVSGAVNPYETMLDFLPPEKQTQLLELEQKYSAKLLGKIKVGSQDAEDLKEARKVQQEKDAELAKLLSPQEKEEFDLRMSPTAMIMRMQLSGFQPTEQEFREIFKLRKSFDDEHSVLGMSSSDKPDQEKRAAAQKILDDQVKTLLGESRFAEYQRVQDYTYQSIAKVAEREGLTTDAAIKVYDMR